MEKEILQDMMPVPKHLGVIVDARQSNGSEKTECVDENPQPNRSNIKAKLFLNVACINGLSLCCDNSDDVMTQLVAISEAIAPSDNAVTGCSIVDLPESLSGAYLLPNGDAFFVPKRSACGFFVANKWVTRVIDVVRLKKGLSELTVSLPSNHCLKVLHCLQICGSYPVSRLQERLAEVRAIPKTSVLVLFGFDGDEEKGQCGLVEQCEAVGLRVWEGFYGEELDKSRNMIASDPIDDFVEVEEVCLEIFDNFPVTSKVDSVKVALKVTGARILPVGLMGKPGPVKANKGVVELVEQNMDKNKRKKERRVKRARRRRRAKEEAKRVLEYMEKQADELLSRKVENDSSVMTQENPGPDDENGENSPEPEATATSGKKKGRKKRNKVIAVDDDVKLIMEKLISDVLEASEEEQVEMNDGQTNSSLVANSTEEEYQEETSTVHDIRLKDLTPENVEIDDCMVYSRRTMQRIRERNLTRLPVELYKFLDSIGLANRDFKERNKEVDDLLMLRREKIRHEQKRERLRAVIARKVDRDVDKVQKDLENFNPFDKVRAGLTEEDWMMSPDEESVNNNAEVVDESVEEPLESAENGETIIKVNVVQEEGEKKSKSRICYENFFISLKEFDPQSLKKKLNQLPVDRFKYSFDDSQNFNNGYKPDIVCSFCESSDHWSDVCPLMIVSYCRTVPELPLTKAFLIEVDEKNFLFLICLFFLPG
ncbi:hypothetical protein COOONC_07498 [Cooperia oncophora]